MDITPLIDEHKKIIRSYSDQRFRINADIFEGNVVVFPDEVHEWHIDKSADSLSEDDFGLILSKADDIDVVFIGCGKSMAMLSPELRAAFSDRNIVVESMDTGAACRTYNVLMAEGRRVVAALMR